MHEVLFVSLLVHVSYTHSQVGGRARRSQIRIPPPRFHALDLDTHSARLFDPEMPLERISPCEALLAARANIRLGSSVHANVALEVVLAREGARAHLAIERLGAGVGLEVGLEVVDAAESLGAAGVRAAHHCREVIEVGIRAGGGGGSSVKVEVERVLWWRGRQSCVERATD